MRKRAVLTSAFVAIWATVASGQTLDGQWWSAATVDQRAHFSAGVLMGARDVASLLLGGDFRESSHLRGAHAAMVGRYLSAVTAARLASGLDVVYAEPINTRIPLRIAVAIVIRELAGASPQEIRRQIEEARAIYR